MLFQKNQKKIGSILRTIYKSNLNKDDIDYLKGQILQIIKKFNKKNPKKKLKVSYRCLIVRGQMVAAPCTARHGA